MICYTRQERIENASRVMNLWGASLSFLSITCKSWPAIKHRTYKAMEKPPSIKNFIQRREK